MTTTETPLPTATSFTSEPIQEATQPAAITRIEVIRDAALANEVGTVALETVQDPIEKAANDVGEVALGEVHPPEADTPLKYEHGVGYVGTINGEEMVWNDFSLDSSGPIPVSAA